MSNGLHIGTNHPSISDDTKIAESFHSDAH